MTPSADFIAEHRRYTSASALVLGASGFIGSSLTHRLHAAGARVSVVGRDRARLHEAVGSAAAEVVVADLSVPGAAAVIVDRVRPSIVFNLAGYGISPTERDPELMTAINANLIAELCGCLIQDARNDWTGLRLVHIGSALEYGPIKGILRETALPQPTTDYGRTKLLGTTHVSHHGSAFGLRAATARLFTVYGPRERPARLLPSIQRLASATGGLALTSGVQCRDFTFVEDVSDALLRLGISDVSPGDVCHVATGTLTSVREFAELAATTFGIDTARLEFGVLPTRGEEMFHGEVDITHLRALLHWAPPTTVRDGLRRTRELALAG